MAGMATLMWVSLASSGRPVAVRAPLTTHWLLAPGLRRITLDWLPFSPAGGVGGCGRGASPPRRLSTSRSASSTAGLRQPLGGGCAPAGRPGPLTTVGLSAG